MKAYTNLFQINVPSTTIVIYTQNKMPYANVVAKFRIARKDGRIPRVQETINDLNSRS